MRGLYRQLQNYLGFSGTEMRGFVIMNLALGMLIFLSWLPISYFFPDFQSQASDSLLLDSLFSRLESEYKPSNNQFETQASLLEKFPKKKQTPKNWQKFDPNQDSKEKLETLPIPSFVLHNLLKYRDKGGRIYRVKDLLKIYGMEESLYQSMKPYVSLAPLSKPLKSETLSHQAKKTKGDSLSGYDTHLPSDGFTKFDINKANVRQLKQIRGIGNVLAERIVKFRKGLGGFFDMEQLEEVYGLSPEVVGRLKDQAFLDPTLIQKISINYATVEDLAAHPYISWNLAKVLVRYRDEHGPYPKEEALSQIKALDNGKLKKLAPYLSFENAKE